MEKKRRSSDRTTNEDSDSKCFKPASDIVFWEDFPTKPKLLRTYRKTLPWVSLSTAAFDFPYEDLQTTTGTDGRSKSRLFVKRERSRSRVKGSESVIVTKRKSKRARDTEQLMRKGKHDQLAFTEGFVYIESDSQFDCDKFLLSEVKSTPYSKLDKEKFYTISPNGVTLWAGQASTFTELDQWETEVDLYCKLVKIDIFSTFRLWKPFKVWRESIRRRKYRDAAKYLGENLILAIPDLAVAATELNTKLQDLTKLSFIDASVTDDWHLFYFIEEQMILHENLRKKLRELRINVRDLLYEGCFKAIQSRGFYPEDEIKVFPSIRKMREAINFIDKVRKKKFCIKLSNFLTYCDYIIINFLHNMGADAFEDLARAFYSKEKLSPSLDEILEGPLEITAHDEKSKVPFFSVNLVLTPAKIDINPPGNVMEEVFQQLSELIVADLIEFQNFTNDTYFSQFTEPSITGRQEDRLTRPPPDLSTLFLENKDYYINREYLKDAIQSSYEKAHAYLKIYEDIRRKFANNMGVNQAALEKETDLTVIRQYCMKYKDFVEEVLSIPLVVDLGFLRLRQDTFRKEIIPVCAEQIKLVNNYLPKLAGKKLYDSIERTQDLIARISADPATVSEFVNYLRFLNEAGKEFVELIAEANFIEDAYKLMEEFTVVIEIEEKEKFAALKENLKRCKIILGNKTTERDKIILQLSEVIRKEIEGVLEEVREVGMEVEEPKYFDKESQVDEIKSQLNNLTGHVQQCQERIQECIKYQNDFNIEVKTYHEVNKTLESINFRRILWTSLEQMEISHTRWNKAYFHLLDIKEFQDKTQEISENCKFLHQNLPTNQLLTELSENVEHLNAELRVITFLRNSKLKLRHWSKIDKILKKRILQEEDINVAQLKELHIYDEEISAQLQAISEQATGEAEQHDVLKNVQVLWKETELSLVPFEESKDVFILTDSEKLKIILDDTNLNMKRILSSKYVEPIKQNAEHWLKLLEKFSLTLDEWLQCQKDWIRLQTIFSAPEINRQLPKEHGIFCIIDKNFKDVVMRAHKVCFALPIMTDEINFLIMQQNNRLIETIFHSLDVFLEMKRTFFPRFYFLSDTELINIYSKMRDLDYIENYVKLLFHGIHKLEYGEEMTRSNVKMKTNEVSAILSYEGEKFYLTDDFKARGPVEDWLSKLEQSMMSSIQSEIESFDYNEDLIEESHFEQLKHLSNQIILTTTTQGWSSQIQCILEQQDNQEISNNLRNQISLLTKNIEFLTSKVREEAFDSLFRRKLCNLIMLRIQQKNTIENLIENQVTAKDDFHWLKVTKFFWDPEEEVLRAHLMFTSIPYGYEYTGAAESPVITPETDRSYLCLMIALHMNYSCFVYGPSGIGKSQTIKELSKTLAKSYFPCYCSENIVYKDVVKLFCGIAQTGAWCCLEEFDRLDIKIISVLAQNIMTIKRSQIAKLERFVFEGREYELSSSCGIFITKTINSSKEMPTRIPENFIVLFRPVALITPNQKFIIEILFSSEGYKSVKSLSKKLWKLFEIGQEQINQYLFDTRMIKSVFQITRRFKFEESKEHSTTEENEELWFVKALRILILPKITDNDIKSFENILFNIFPSSIESVKTLSLNRTVELEDIIQQQLFQNRIDADDGLLVVKDKCLQLYEFLELAQYMGVLIVGEAGAGKTTIINSLENAQNILSGKSSTEENHQIISRTLLQQAIHFSDLFGCFNEDNKLWSDGLIIRMIKGAMEDDQKRNHWIILDGQLKPKFLENFLTLLDENSRTIYLSSLKKIKVTTNSIKFIFETDRLENCSPSFVSKCGIIHVEKHKSLNWRRILHSWREENEERYPIFLKHFCEFHEKYFPDILKFSSNTNKSLEIINGNNIRNQMKIITDLTLSIFEELDESRRTKKRESIPNSIEDEIEEKILHDFIGKIFLWTVFWGINSPYEEQDRQAFEKYLRNLITTDKNIEFPTENELQNYILSVQKKDWELLTDEIEKFTCSGNRSLINLILPTVPILQYKHILGNLISNGNPVMITGSSSSGKSALIEILMKHFSAKKRIISTNVEFCSRSTVKGFQSIIRMYLEKMQHNQLSAPIGKSVVIFIDDVNLSRVEEDNHQLPMEFLRQILSVKGWYDGKTLLFKAITNLTLCTTWNTEFTYDSAFNYHRFSGHFLKFHVAPVDSETYKRIYRHLLQEFFKDAPNSSTIKNLLDAITNTCLDMYNFVRSEFPSNPINPHYLFNGKDLGKCFQGILQCSSNESFNNEQKMMRFISHEILRTFYDRLASKEHCEQMIGNLKETMAKHFSLNTPKDLRFIDNNKIYFVNFLNQAKSFEEIADINKIKNLLISHVEKMSSKDSTVVILEKDNEFIFFNQAIEQVIKISRSLKLSRGNGGLLIGSPGIGKKSLTKLAANLNEQKFYEFDPNMVPNYSLFIEELMQKIYKITGANEIPLVFYIEDKQIVDENIFGDFCEILSRGEISTLYSEGGNVNEKDLFEKVKDSLHEKENDYLKRILIRKLLTQKIRKFLHLMLSILPGKSLRNIAQMYPSLIKNLSIIWFSNWPDDVLLSISMNVLENLEDDEERRTNLSNVCVDLYKSIYYSPVVFYLGIDWYQHYALPSRYFEFLRFYKTLLKRQTILIYEKQQKLAGALNKILKTYEMVNTMQTEIETLLPLLDKQTAELAEMGQKLEEDTKRAEEIKDTVITDELIVKEKTTLSQAISDDTAKDLEIAMPALREAEEGIKGFTKPELTDLKALQSPPQLVQITFEAVCILLGNKPTWASAKTLMTDVTFQSRLLEYDKEHVQEPTLKKIKKYIENKDFNPAKIEKLSKVSKYLSLWVIAIDKFAKVYKVVEPKIRKQEVAESELRDATKILRSKQQEFAEIEARIQVLKDNIEEKTMEFNKTKDDISLTNLRLNRASKLLAALAEEKIRWKDELDILAKRYNSLSGDILLSAANVTYLSIFPPYFRKDLTDKWIQKCLESNISCNRSFEIVSVLKELYEIQDKKIDDFEEDIASMENGLHVMLTCRWPILVDPEGLALKWIKLMQGKSNLQNIEMTNPKLKEVLKSSISLGSTLVVELIGSRLNSLLGEFLSKNPYPAKDEKKSLRLGNTGINCNKNFKLFLITKSLRKSYPKGILRNVSFIRFTTTKESLEENLITKTSFARHSEFETTKKDLHEQIVFDEQIIFKLEKDIIRMLLESRGNILDDEDLIDKINDIKETFLLKTAHLNSIEEKLSTLVASREIYRSVAERGVILYLVSATLMEIDPMYQYSLEDFIEIYCSVIKNRKFTPMDLEEILLQTIYNYISRGLLEDHRLLFNFILSVALERQNGSITEDEFDFLIRNIQERKLRTFAIKKTLISEIEKKFPAFEGIVEDLLGKNIPISVNNFSKSVTLQEKDEETPKEDSTVPWNERLTSFQKLIVFSVFETNSFYKIVENYIKLILEKLDNSIRPSEISNLEAIWKETANTKPIMILLSGKYDPNRTIKNFIESRRYSSRFVSISLGDYSSQEHYITGMVQRSMKHGGWVLLQNCHMNLQWMEQFEVIFYKIISNQIVETPHEDFRLFLTSASDRDFPKNILTNSVKISFDRPSGVEKNMLRIFEDFLTDDYFERHAFQQEWKSLLLRLSKFHSILIEKWKLYDNFQFNQKWTINYVNSDNDIQLGLRIIDSYLDRERIGSIIPWKLISNLCIEAVWGGTCNDSWEQRYLRALFEKYVLNEVFPEIEDKRFDSYGECKNYISKVNWLKEDKETSNVFGLCAMKNDIIEREKSRRFLNLMFSRQDKKDSLNRNDFSESTITRCIEVIDYVNKNLNLDDSILKFDIVLKKENAEKNKLRPLETVLLSEIGIIKVLLKNVKADLENLRKSLRGQKLIKRYEEEMFQEILESEVPRRWKYKEFSFSKSLITWAEDVKQKINFLQEWMNERHVTLWWIGGFFRPKAFLHGVLQEYCVQNSTKSLESLCFNFEVKKFLKKRDNDGSKKDNHDEMNILIYGLFIKNASWNIETGKLHDLDMKYLYSPFPAVALRPSSTRDEKEPSVYYETPVYQTEMENPENFIFSIPLNSENESNFWTLRRAALFTKIPK